jgi:hypothetical protein
MRDTGSIKLTPFAFQVATEESAKGPIPSTVAIKSEPPIDPAFGEIDISFGSRLKDLP